MSYQRGTNAGLSGTISIPGVGALFEVQIFTWKPRMAGTPKPRRGRGGGVYRTFRWMMSSGTGACSGKPNLDGWPAPNAWKGQTGTLTVQVHTSKTVAYPVLITEMGFDFTEKTQDLPDVFFTWQVTGEPTYTGWGAGSQPTATDPSKADQEQWEGTSKTKDTGNLESTAIRLTDVWGTLGDTDSAENTKLAAIISAAQAPFSGMKLNTAVLARDAIDGGTVTETWQLTTSDERVINDATVLDVDPNGRTSQAVTAVFNGTPSASAGLVVRGLTTKEYNDNMVLRTKQHGTRSTIEDLTFANTKTFHDVSVIAEEDLFCASFTTGSPPADPTPPVGKVIAEYFDVPDTSPDSTNLSYRVYVYSLVSNAQKHTLAQYELSTDPFLLQNTKRSAVIWDSGGSAPSDPGVPSGMVLINKTDLGIPTHSTKQIRVYRWGQRTSDDEETFGKTRYQTDASTLEQEDSVADVFVTGTTPTPPTRSGMVVAGFYDVPVTNAGASNLSCRVYQMRYVTNSQRRTLPQYELATDPNDLDTKARSAVIWDSGGSAPSDPGLPSGLKLLNKIDVSVNTHPTLRVRIYNHAKNDSKDEIERPRTTYEATSFLAQRAANATVLTTTDVPSTTGAAAFALLKDDVTFERLSVVKLDPDHSVKVVTTQVAAKIVRGRSSGTKRVITPAYYDGSDVYVFMRRKIKIGTNLWDYELAEQYMQGEKICFTLSRRVSGSTLPYFTNLLNTKNAASFLGLAAGYVTYLGVAESATNLAVAANRVSEITWEFEYDSLGIIDMADASPGWASTTTDLTSVGPGWVKASDLGLSADVQPDGDYDGFLA